MNRDELLEECFGKTIDELPVPAHWFNYEDPDRQGHVFSLVGLGWRSVIVRNSQPPSAGEVTVATTTVRVAAIMNVCTDPDHRGQGYATLQMLAAHEFAEQHELTDYAALFAGPERVSFYEQFGYSHPAGARDPNFLVAELRDDVPWPEGSVMLREQW